MIVISSDKTQSVEYKGNVYIAPDSLIVFAEGVLIAKCSSIYEAQNLLVSLAKTYQRYPDAVLMYSNEALLHVT